MPVEVGPFIRNELPVPAEPLGDPLHPVDVETGRAILAQELERRIRKRRADLQDLAIFCRLAGLHLACGTPNENPRRQS
jgi:hypothetical protein